MINNFYSYGNMTVGARVATGPANFLKGTWLKVTDLIRNNKPETHVHVIEKSAYLEACELIDEIEKYLSYYPENCDACNFSGVDEKEFSARGCPSCDCLQAREALSKIKAFKEKGESDAAE